MISIDGERASMTIGAGIGARGAEMVFAEISPSELCFRILTSAKSCESSTFT